MTQYQLNDIESKIGFYVDSQAALQSVAALSCTQITAIVARDSLIILGCTNIVKLTWVKSHKGIAGNNFNKLQQADKAARAGTNSDTIGPNIPIWDCSLEQVGIDKKYPSIGGKNIYFSDTYMLSPQRVKLKWRPGSLNGLWGKPHHYLFIELSCVKAPLLVLFKWVRLGNGLVHKIWLISNKSL